MPIDVGVRELVKSVVHDLLTEPSICGNKRTITLKLLTEIAEDSKIPLGVEYRDSA